MLPEDPRLPIVSTAAGYLQNLNNRLNDLFRKFAYEINNKRTFGTDGINYSQFDEDGTLQSYGDATCFRDEISDLVKAGLNNPSSHIVYDYTEGALGFATNCDSNDWAVMNIQLNHDWKAGSDVYPHIHWWQTENKTPNWLIQYRWQKSGAAKTTSWTYKIYTSNVFTYTSGTLNQKTLFGAISAPAGYGLSDILQIRYLRDDADTSGAFSGSTSTYSTTAQATSADTHIEIDMLGSRTLSSK